MCLAQLIAVIMECLLVAGCGGGGSHGSASSPPPVNAGTLPLLEVNKLVGVVYSAPAPAAQAALNADFSSCIAAGANTYELSVTWASLEPTPGTVDVSSLSALLTTVKSSGLIPYLVIKTIDTNQLALPADLMSATDSSQFAGTLTFDSTTVLQRFGALMDQVTPLLVQQGGFYLSVGNEVDVWLTNNPSAQSQYVTFLSQARSQVHLSDNRLAVGATCTSGVVTTAPNLLSSLLSVSDAISYTYYPLNSDFTVRDPSVVAGDLAQLVSSSAGQFVLLQEAGYPSGYIPTPGNGSSVAKQQQFVQNVFSALAAQTSIRFCSFMQLADYTAAEVATFETYYGISQPEFVEYLSTLGFVDDTGVAKGAFQALLTGLATVMSMPSAPG
jgi:exo-beta-1,3-glucanase (GH17 family)